MHYFYRVIHIIQCRIWSLNGVAVNKALVGTISCKAETLLKNKETRFNNNFKGDGPAEAICCNWSRCNIDLSTAKLEAAPQSSSSSTSVKTITTTILS